MLKKGNKQKLCFEEFVGQIYCIFPTNNTFSSLRQLPTAWGRPIKDRELNLLSQTILCEKTKQIICERKSTYQYFVFRIVEKRLLIVKN